MSAKETPIREGMLQAGFFKELSRDDLEKVAALATIEEHKAGTILFREGAVSDQLFLIVAGRVALDMHMPHRGKVRILTVGPGEVLGWSALLSDQGMTTMATVVEDARMISLPGRKLHALCEADTDVGYAVMQRMAIALAHRLLATRLQLLDLFQETQSADVK